MAGEEIDATLGVKLGLSTLASAGLGNLVSDVAGIGFADQLEVSHSNGLAFDRNCDVKPSLHIQKFCQGVVVK